MRRARENRARRLARHAADADARRAVSGVAARQLGEIARQLQGAPAHFFTAMFYVISAVHGLHLLGGLVFVAMLLYQAQVLQCVDAQSVELGAIYWHFLGVLWAVLFGVMLIK
jgi:heme/copper-type cytochrome/quinol oxidase subunit 3